MGYKHGITVFDTFKTITFDRIYRIDWINFYNLSCYPSEITFSTANYFYYNQLHTSMDIRQCKKGCEECTPCDDCGAPQFTINVICGSCLCCETPHVEMYEWR